MSLLIEFHVIQNFAPSNLNRDDTGAPKDAVFGGVARARISSQCFKRAVRTHASGLSTLPESARGVRTKKLVSMLSERLHAMGYEESAAQISTALEAAKLKLDDKGLTQYLLFLGRREVDALAQTIAEHWAALTPGEQGAGEKAKRTKKEAKAAAPEEVAKAVARLLDGGKAIDIALFGRMLADLPEANRHAACQVAHAISTHRVEREFDYFTAVDDLGSVEETGAGMIGTVEFNSATFYRYAVLDIDKLRQNLGDDDALALQGLRAFAEAFVRAEPSGKQNSFAAHNAPSFVGAAVRHGSPFNLANAFERPVHASREGSLTETSVHALAQYEQTLARIYGDARDAWAVLDTTERWPGQVGEKLPNLSAWLDWLQARGGAARQAD